METRQRTETYNGLDIIVNAYQTGPRSWSWTYVVKNVTNGKSPRDMPDAEAALTRALLIARLYVDEMV